MRPALISGQDSLCSLARGGEWEASGLCLVWCRMDPLQAGPWEEQQGLQGETSTAPTPHYLGILGKHQAGLQPAEALCQCFHLSAPSDHRTKLTRSARNPSDPKQRHDPPKVTKRGAPAQPEAEPGSSDSSSPDFALRGDRARAVKAGTDCRRCVPAGHFHLAPRSTRAANAFQVALPPAGSSALCWASFVCSCPGSSPSYPPPRGRPVAGQLSRLSVNLPALLLKVLLHKAASPGQNGSPLT